MLSSACSMLTRVFSFSLSSTVACIMIRCRTDGMFSATKAPVTSTTSVMVMAATVMSMIRVVFFIYPAKIVQTE